jgi:hypothetical protein
MITPRYVDLYRMKFHRSVVPIQCVIAQQQKYDNY